MGQRAGQGGRVRNESGTFVCERALQCGIRASFVVGPCHGRYAQSEGDDYSDCESLCDSALFHIHLLWVHKLPPFRKEIILTACSPSAGTGGSGPPKAATF